MSQPDYNPSFLYEIILIVVGIHSILICSIYKREEIITTSFICLQYVIKYRHVWEGLGDTYTGPHILYGNINNSHANNSQSY